MSGSKRLKRAIGHSGKAGTYGARRVAHKAIEQDVSKWIAHIASTQGPSTLVETQLAYVRGKEIKARLERNN